MCACMYCVNVCVFWSWVVGVLVAAAVAFLEEEEWGLLRWAQQHGDLVLVRDPDL